MIFRFKNFSLQHHKSSMKVGTDAVLLGAWADVENSKKILDIGTGCGIIALMLAQRSNSNIDALDIDKESYIESLENFSSSLWKERLNSYNISLQKFAENKFSEYDLIVSNPPYFKSSFKPEISSRLNARHDVALTTEDLLFYSSKLIKPDGKLCFIFPYEDMEMFKMTANSYGLYCNKSLLIRPNEEGTYIRCILQLEKIKKENIIYEMSIEKDKRHEYTDEYKNLTKDFYIDF